MKIKFIGEITRHTGITPYDVNISNPEEILPFIEVNFKVPDEMLYGYCVVVKNSDQDLYVITPENSKQLINPNAEIFIVPTSDGKYEALLIIVAAVIGVSTASTVAIAVTVAIMVAYYAAMIAMLVLSFVNRNKGGVKERAGIKAKPSYIFNGAVNVTTQGSPVPLLYGEAIIGSQVVSGNVTNKDRKKK